MTSPVRPVNREPVTFPVQWPVRFWKHCKYVVSKFSRILNHPSSKVGSWASISLNFLGLTQMDPRVSLQMLLSWPHSGFERNNSIHTATLKCCLMRNLFILNYVIYIYIKKGWPFKKTPSFCHWWCSFDVMLVWTLSPFLASLGAHVIELTAQRVLLLPFPWAKGHLSWDYNL